MAEEDLRSQPRQSHAKERFANRAFSWEILISLPCAFCNEKAHSHLTVFRSIAVAASVDRCYHLLIHFGNELNSLMVYTLLIAIVAFAAGEMFAEVFEM